MLADAGSSRVDVFRVDGDRFNSKYVGGES
jgi:hypothetical protein